MNDDAATLDRPATTNKRDGRRVDRMTAVNEGSDGLVPVVASAEGNPARDDWDSGSYVNALREDFASTFASAPSLRPAVQGTSTIAKPLRIQQPPHYVPGRTPIHGRPIILRDLRKPTSSLLTQEETSRLLRSLTQRDVAILQALHHYRYLNTLQVQQLFFHGIRSAQMRLRFLSHHGLLYRWQMIDPPGLTRRHSLLLLTPRGGRLLAEHCGESPWSYLRRAKDARDHCWHVAHDLEANGFFVDLAVASRLTVNEGLLLWVGEESSRSSRRVWAKEHRRPIATPDGEACYVANGRTIRFDLEWDRGTESIVRLRAKLRTYVGFYKHTKGADREHVLFVLNRDGREALVHNLLRDLFEARRDCCRFWTTTIGRIDRVGALGPLWAAAGKRDSGKDDEEDLEDARPADPRRLHRRRLAELPAESPSTRTIADCIGRAGWWERRPGGGEVG